MVVDLEHQVMTALSAPSEAATAAALAQHAQSRALARSLELPVLGGNQARLLHGLAACWGHVFDAIGQARDHVNLEGPLPVGPTFDAWLERLAGACRRGVHVNAMLEGQIGGSVVARLRRVGIRVCGPAPMESAWSWWHDDDRGTQPRTLVVVDGRTAFIGTLESHGAPGDGARRGSAAAAPRLLRVEGPAVAELQWLFVDAWRQRLEGPMPAGRHFPPLPWIGGHRVGLAPGGSDVESSSPSRALLGALDAAQDRALLIADAHSSPKALEAGVAAASARGVDVHVLMADDGHRLLPARRGASALQRAGAHVHLIRHQVTAACSVIDGVWSSVALGRARTAGLARGEQDHVIVLDTSFADEAQDAFWRDVERCCSEALPRWAPPRALQRLNLRIAKYLEVGL
jgi:cardiolipin synthase